MAHLMDHLEEHRILTKLQHGFGQKHSCTSLHQKIPLGIFRCLSVFSVHFRVCSITDFWRLSEIISLFSDWRKGKGIKVKMATSMEEVNFAPITRIFSDISEKLNLKSILTAGSDSVGSTARYSEASEAVAAGVRRQEIIAKLISSCIGLGLSLTITYFGFRYLANVLDPTREEKKRAQLRVSLCRVHGKNRRSVFR